MTKLKTCLSHIESWAHDLHEGKANPKLIAADMDEFLSGINTAPDKKPSKALLDLMASYGVAITGNYKRDLFELAKVMGLR
jgi:hypothetical protein